MIVTDGGFRPDGTFVHRPTHDPERLAEAFRRAVRRLFGRKDLDGHGALEAEVLRQVHRAHSTLPELALDMVPLVECGLEDVAHAENLRRGGLPGHWNATVLATGI
jgi:hypothetical protein